MFVPNQRTTFPLHVRDRCHSRQKPSELAGRLAQREFHIESGSRSTDSFQRRGPPAESPGSCTACQPRLKHLFRCCAGVFIPAVVVPEYLAIRLRHPSQMRDRVRQPSELLFIGSMRRFRLLAVGDVAKHQHSAGHIPVVVQNRRGVVLNRDLRARLRNQNGLAYRGIRLRASDTFG